MMNIPNILTLINMSLGLCAVLLLIQTDHPHKAFISTALIMLGGIVDFFDGFIARKLNATSSMGKQLDSFADIITFGTAPALLINYISTCRPSILIIVSSLIFTVAGAYRLARFNLSDYQDHFLGLPIPVAGIALAIYSAAYTLWPPVHPGICTVITASFIIILSVMMVSKKKIKRIALHSIF